MIVLTALACPAGALLPGVLLGKMLKRAGRQHAAPGRPSWCEFGPHDLDELADGHGPVI